MPAMTSEQWIQRLAGRFVVFDGPDGSGKSTQFRRFAAHCRERGVKVCDVREPGGTPIGEQIRKILLDPASEMSLRCEMLLYMASRAQLVEQVITPAIERGELVLADRFISSTLAYQGDAGGLPLEEIVKVGEVAIGQQRPDLVVIFDIDEQQAAKRMAGGERGGKEKKSGAAAAPLSLFADRLELRGLEYQRRVREGFLAQARRDPDRYLIVDASRDPDAVFHSLLTQVAERV
jgi:dTMP kinase